MGNIFISHVIADEPLMHEIAQGLEEAGYTAWFFERDVLPGTSYLIQITRAIEECDALVLMVTPAALSSDQVTKERDPGPAGPGKDSGGRRLRSDAGSL